MEETPSAPRDGRQQGSVACQKRQAAAGGRLLRSRIIVSSEWLRAPENTLTRQLFLVSPDWRGFEDLGRITHQAHAGRTVTRTRQNGKNGRDNPSSWRHPDVSSRMYKSEDATVCRVT